MWAIWALTLLVQNTTFSITSRARASGSYVYNFVASLGSNGSWYVAQFFTVGLITKAIADEDLVFAALVGAFYTTFTAIGSVIGQYVSKRWIETGKRRVGA
jgi:hypothetical protein